MSEDMKELERQISEAEKSMLQAKEVYEAKIEKLAKLLEQRDRIRRGLDGGRVTLDKWTYNWNGNAIWDYGTVTVDCHFQASMTFGKGDSVVRGPEVQKLEMEKPGFSEEDVIIALQDSLRDMLDQEFDDYCTEDDYYQPVVEDFEAEEYAREWAEERNIELTSFEGIGFDGGFEPKHRGWR